MLNGRERERGERKEIERNCVLESDTDEREKD